MRYLAAGDFYAIQAWVSDLETRPKNLNFDGLGLKNAILNCLAY
jgi:hypothetical protein